MGRENWYLQTVQRGIEPVNEANTSRYVHEVIQHCFGWPFDQILPQPSKRGFIDYRLRFTRPVVDVHIEVKPFGIPLRDEMIRKYVVRRGPMPEGFQVGALTNLKEWQVFVAGPAVRQAAGESMVQLLWYDIECRSDIDAIRRLIGHRHNGEMREIRASLGETEDVLVHLLSHDDMVLSAIRRALGEIRDRHSLGVPVPQKVALSAYVGILLGGDWDEECPFTPAKMKQALSSAGVADAADRRLQQLFGARSRRVRIQQTIKQLVKEAGEELEEAS
jgi:hypothetical protein